jgi:hypothetical protein
METEITKQNKKINETTSWLFENIYKIDKSLVKVTKKEKAQINKIRDEKGKIKTNTNGIQKIIMEYLENLYYNKLEI